MLKSIWKRRIEGKEGPGIEKVNTTRSRIRPHVFIDIETEKKGQWADNLKKLNSHENKTVQKQELKQIPRDGFISNSFKL